MNGVLRYDASYQAVSAPPTLRSELETGGENQCSGLLRCSPVCDWSTNRLKQEKLSAFSAHSVELSDEENA